MSGNLFTVEGGEVAHDDIDSCVESEIDPWWDEEHPDKVWIVEEWTSRPVHVHEGWLTEHAVEMATEDIDDDGERYDALIADPEVIAAANTLARLVESKINYRWCDKRIARYEVRANPDSYIGYIITRLTDQTDAKA